MKKNTAYTIGSLVILLICAFCFVILPALTGSGQARAKSPVFGKYDGKAITMDEGSAMQKNASQYAQLLEAYGQKIDQNTSFQVFNYAFNKTALDYAYEDAVKDSGYVVTPKAVNYKMIPYFLDENGKYSSKLYKQVPENRKQELRDELENSLYSARFYDDNFGSSSDIVGLNALYGLKTSNDEIQFLIDLDKTKRGFNMAYYPSDSYPEEEVVKYGKANIDKFTKYNFSAISVADETTANTVIRRLNNNEITFADAVSEYSSKSYGDSEGKLADIYSYQISDMLTNEDDLATITALAVDALSTPIQTGSSYTVFKADAAPKAGDMTNADTIASVKSYLISYENSIIEDYFMAKANNLINEANKSDLATACANQGVETITIAPFPLNYGNMEIASTLDTSNAVLANAESNDNFLKTAFSLKLNEYSKPFVLNKNVCVLQYTTEEVAADDYTPVFKAETSLSYDQYATQDHVLHSEKLENNFAQVYFDQMMR